MTLTRIESEDPRIEDAIQAMYDEGPLQGPRVLWEHLCGFYRINRGPWQRDARWRFPRLSAERLPQ